MKATELRVKRKFHKIKGLVDEIKYVIFGKVIWTENIPIEKEEIPDYKYNAELKEITGYVKWRQDNHLMRLSNEELERLINTRF